jgi:hypothetical protein
MSRCRICSANDRESLINEMAAEMWNTQRSSNKDDEWRPWEQAGPYWHQMMRQFAEATLNVLQREPS